MTIQMERIDRLTSPPVIGQFYLVPTLRCVYFERDADWPVIGPKHDDVEFFNFSYPHYHIDVRFLGRGESKTRIANAHTYVLHGVVAGSSRKPTPLPEIVWRKRRCTRDDYRFSLPVGRFVDVTPLDALRRAFAGRQCQRNAGGFVCPHRNAPLGSLKPIDGVISCPLHGLRIDAKTGVVVK